MALQINHTFRGLNINGAYFRITQVPEFAGAIDV